MMRAIYDPLAPTLTYEQRYTRTLVHSSRDTRELCPPPLKMRPIKHASHGARER